MAAASAAKRAASRTRSWCRTRARWRSRPRMSLAVKKIDSMRWRIGARCGPRPFSSLRGGRWIWASSAQVGLELSAAEVLVADDDQHLAGLAFAARDELQADGLLVDLRGGQRQRARGVPSSANSACSRKPQKKRLWLAQ